MYRAKSLLLGLTVVALAVGYSVALAGGGNSLNAKSCQKNGWVGLVTSTGASFANQGACVSYSAKGDILYKAQTITFAALANKTFGDADFTVSATASSGLAVTFTASGNCTVAGSSVHLTGAGSCTITAHQAGDATWYKAPDVVRTFSIGKANQTITFTTPNPSPVVVGSGYTPTATASSGLTVAITLDGASSGCSLSGGVVSFDSVGTCLIDANQAGNADWDAATQEQQSIAINIPTTLLLDVSDPSFDDNGPGNYAYPTSDSFKPGAYDIQEFQVYDAGSDVIFQLKTRDLTPTFGSPLGAQLVDVYVHVPGAATTSTAAAFPQRNYTIAAGSAWSRLIEVQGFGQRYIDASGTTLGTVVISANETSRFITFSVPKASLGQPGSGWGFTVVLTGQDGFSPDQSRGFQPTPQNFQFGVCATASADPHCTFAPNLVPKAVDVIMPVGLSQSIELDYTLGAVVVRGVVIP